MTSHPSTEELRQYLDEGLGEQAPALADHVEACPACQERLEGQADAAPTWLSPLLPECPHGPDEPELRPGPRYELRGELGRGGMSVVYKAWDRELQRPVALKVFAAGVRGRGRALDRLRAEAVAQARVAHPGVVQIHDVCTDRTPPFLSLEYCAGGSLAEWAPRHAPAPRQAAQIVQALAEAMEAAHARGVLHRDLKPGNVLLAEEGRPKIGDFGLARVLNEEAAPTESPEVLGTPCYAAPENLLGRRAVPGPAADVYGLGAILYELLTGRPPFRGSTLLETLEQVRTREPLPPRQLTPAVSRDLETICLKCLEKAPAGRYASCQVLADDLRRFLNGEPITARPVSAAGRGWRWCRRRPLVAGLVAALVLAVLGGLGGMFHLWRQAEASAREARGHEARALESLHEMQAAQEQAAKGTALGTDVLTELGHFIGESFNRTPEQNLRLRLELIPRLKDACQRLAALDPKSSAVQYLTAGYCSLLADYYQVSGRWTEACDVMEESVLFYEALVQQHPRVANYRHALLRGRLTAGLLRVHVGDGDKARTFFRRAQAQAEELKTDTRALVEDPPFYLSCAKIFVDIGGSGLLLRVPELSLGLHDQGIALAERFRQQCPDLPEGPTQLVRAWYSRGKTLWKADRADEALDSFRQAIGVARELHRQVPAAREHRLLFSDFLGKGAYWLGKRGRLAEAEACLHEVEPLWPDDAGQLAELAGDWRQLAGAVGRGTDTLTAEEEARRREHHRHSARLARLAGAVLVPDFARK